MQQMKRSRKVIIFLTILAAAIFLFLGAALYILLGHPKNPPLSTGNFKVGETAFEVEIADTVVKRTLGLSGREELEEGKGMLFVFPEKSQQGFWMKDMKFSIDIIWISGDIVIGFAENAAPEPGVPVYSLKVHHSPEPVDRVLEIPAGGVQKYGIKVGDNARTVDQQ